MQGANSWHVATSHTAYCPNPTDNTDTRPSKQSAAASAAPALPASGSSDIIKRQRLTPAIQTCACIFTTTHSSYTRRPCCACVMRSLPNYSGTSESNGNSYPGDLADYGSSLVHPGLWLCWRSVPSVIQEGVLCQTGLQGTCAVDPVKQCLLRLDRDGAIAATSRC